MSHFASGRRAAYAHCGSMTETAKLSAVGQWRAIQRVYPIYKAVAEQFGLGTPPYASLEQVTDASEEQVTEVAGRWLAEMDDRIESFQFRATLERPDIVNSEEKLRGLVNRYLYKQTRSTADRDKLQYLLTQYAYVCAPPSFRARITSLAELAEVLEPVLGDCTEEPPAEVRVLTGLVDLMPRCGTFEELEATVVVPGREVKGQLGERWPEMPALLAVTHFNYSLRCAYARLLSEEVHASQERLAQLQERQITTVDCTALGLSASEPLDILKDCLVDLGGTAPADYAVVNARSEQVRALRSTIEAALRQTAAGPAPDTPQPLASVEIYFERLVSEFREVKAELEDLRRLIQERTAAAGYAALPPVTSEVMMAAEKAWAAMEVAEARAAGQAPSAPPAEASPPPEPSPAKSEPAAGAKMMSPDELQKAAVPRPATDFAFEVNRCITALRRVLEPNRKQASAGVKVGAATVVLSQGELEALFTEGSAAALAHRGLTARILLLNSIEKSKHGQNADAEGRLLEFARKTLGELQQVQTESGASAPEVLANTARQLRIVLQHAEAKAQAARAVNG
jgi:hypothetical protein